MSEETFTSLEREALGMLLAGDNSQLKILRHQLSNAAVSKRESTGVGFFTHFQVPAHIPRLSKRERITLGDISVETKELKHGAGIILFIDDGVLNFLESVTPVETWPDMIANFTITYLKESPRGSGRLQPSKVRDVEFALKDLSA